MADCAHLSCDLTNRIKAKLKAHTIQEFLENIKGRGIHKIQGVPSA